MEGREEIGGWEGEGWERGKLDKARIGGTGGSVVRSARLLELHLDRRMGGGATGVAQDN